MALPYRQGQAEAHSPRLSHWLPLTWSHIPAVPDLLWLLQSKLMKPASISGMNPFLAVDPTRVQLLNYSLTPLCL